jgi:hypothetical protein
MFNNQLVSWTCISDFMNINTCGVTSITAAPGNPNIVYAALGSRGYFSGYGYGVIRSDDGGLSWTRIYEPDGPIQLAWGHPSINKVIVSPNNPNEVYLVSDAKIFYKANVMAPGGWTDIPRPTNHAHLRGGFLQANGRLVLTSSYNSAPAGIYFTSDNGQSWTSINIPPNNDPAYNLYTVTFAAPHPQNPDILFYNIMYSYCPTCTNCTCFKKESFYSYNFSTNSSGALIEDAVGIDYFANGLGIFNVRASCSSLSCATIYTGNCNNGSSKSIKYNSNSGNWELADYIPYSTTGAPFYEPVHVDHRVLAISATGKAVLGNDGGVSFNDDVDDANGWKRLQTPDFVIHQQYDMDVHEYVEDVTVVAALDNHCKQTTNGGATWFDRHVGDGFNSKVDINYSTGRPYTYYQGNQYLTRFNGSVYSPWLNTGTSMQIIPVLSDPVNPDLFHFVYQGSGLRYRKASFAGSSTGLSNPVIISPNTTDVSTLAISESNPNKMIATLRWTRNADCNTQIPTPGCSKHLTAVLHGRM